MKFSEKLRRLMVGREQADVAKSAKIAPSALSNYLAEKSMPRVEIALSLSKEFGCSLAWMVDDSREWEDADRSAAVELAKRYIRVALKLKSEIQRARQVNWISVAKLAASLSPNEPIPSSIEAEIDLIKFLMWARRGLARFDVCHNPMSFVKPEEVPIEASGEMKIEKLQDDISRCIEKTHGLATVVMAMNLRAVKGSELDFPPDQTAELEKSLKAAMKNLEVPITVAKKRKA